MKTNGRVIPSSQHRLVLETQTALSQREACWLRVTHLWWTKGPQAHLQALAVIHHPGGQVRCSARQLISAASESHSASLDTPPPHPPFSWPEGNKPVPFDWGYSQVPRGRSWLFPSASKWFSTPQSTWNEKDCSSLPSTEAASAVSHADTCSSRLGVFYAKHRRVA